MSESSVLEIIRLVRSEVERVYGREYADHTIVDYQKSWFHFSEPFQEEGGKYKVNPITKPMRRKEMLEFLETLRTMKPMK